MALRAATEAASAPMGTIGYAEAQRDYVARREALYAVMR